ncbi:unnamed protein product [Effrenium voratum]|nr:unnamed protein product [Effrenium voratum]
MKKVYHTMCKMSRKAGFQRPQVIAASVRKPIGRVQIWKKLWRSVEKDEQRGLPQLRKELDALVAAEDVAALRAAVEQATGADAWDYALRAMLRVSSGALRREVWGLVRNTSPEPGVEMLLADQDTDLDDLQESLLEAAELDEEEEEALKEEQPQEPEEEPEEEEEEEEEEEQEEATNLFQPKEGLLLSAAQERAALAVGEVAFQADPPDLELAEEVLRELQGPPLAELLMEQVVCSAQLGPPFSEAFRELEALQQLVAQDPQMRPWSADRWNRLLRCVGAVRENTYVEQVLQHMERLQVTGDKVQLGRYA